MLSDFGSHCLSAAFIGERAAFALADGTVRRIGTEVDCIQAHAVSSLAAVSVAGEDAMLTSGEDGRVCRIESSGACREVGAAPRKWITSVGASRGRLAWAAGKTVWLAGAGGTVGAHQLQHPRGVKGIAFSRDGRFLAVAQQDGVSVHDTDAAIDTGPTAAPLELAWNDIHTASTFSPDGRFLVIAAQNCFLHGWRLADRKHFRMLGYQARVDGWDWSSDGLLLATSGATAAIVWPFDGDDGPMTRSAYELAARPGSKVGAVAWRPGTRQLAVGWDDGAVQLASFDEPQAPARLLREAGRAPVTSVAWNAGGTRVAFGSAAGECGVAMVQP